MMKTYPACKVLNLMSTKLKAQICLPICAVKNFSQSGSGPILIRVFARYTGQLCTSCCGLIILILNLISFSKIASVPPAVCRLLYSTFTCLNPIVPEDHNFFNTQTMKISHRSTLFCFLFKCVFRVIKRAFRQFLLVPRT